MAIYKHVSSKEIIRKVFRDLKPATGNWIHDSIEWIGEALEHIGASAQLCTKHAVIPITNHKGSLPGDLYYINQVAINTCVSASVDLQINTVVDQIQALNSNILDYSEQLSSFTSSSSPSKAPSAKFGSITDASSPAALAVSGGSKSSTVASAATSSSINDFRVASNNQLRDLNVNLEMLTNMYFTGGSCLSPLQYGASTFHNSIHCDGCVNATVRYKDTYIIDCEIGRASCRERV